MRRLFMGADSGLTNHALRWAVRCGRIQRVQRDVFADGEEPVSDLDRERASVLASGSPARGGLGGVLLGLDSVTLDGAPTRRTECATTTSVVEDTLCADARTVLLDLAATLQDDVWEQVLESALRKRLVRLDAFDDLPRGVPGVRRVRRVLERRGDVPPTESLLELDGQGHKDQPVYDANRQTNVVTATGWLVGRYTWREVVHTPRSTARRLVALVATARRAA